jgi:hypothetical protein
MIAEEQVFAVLRIMSRPISFGNLNRWRRRMLLPCQYYSGPTHKKQKNVVLINSLQSVINSVFARKK